jgi:hypothetical protein
MVTSLKHGAPAIALIELEREMLALQDRQTEMQTDRHTDRHTNGQTDRQTDGRTDRQCLTCNAGVEEAAKEVQHAESTVTDCATLGCEQQYSTVVRRGAEQNIVS